MRALGRPHHHGCAVARPYQVLGLVGMQHRDGVGTTQLATGGAHRGKQIALVERIHQVNHHLGIGLAGKHVALLAELGAQGFVVFNDAVVHQGNPRRRMLRRAGIYTRAVAKVRVGVVLSRCAVCGPTGVGNAHATLQAVVLHLGL